MTVERCNDDFGVLHREDQLELLRAFVNVDTVRDLGLVVVHGYKSGGKTLTVKTHLKNLGIKYTIVNCDECISKKIVLQRALKNYSIDSKVPPSLWGYDRIGDYGENFSSFITALEGFKNKSGYDDPHILILDRIDRCMEASNELFSSFARLKEQSTICNLLTIIITSSDDPIEIASNSIPHVFFQEYSETQIVEILQSTQFCKFGTSELDENPNSLEFWNQYVKIVVDLYFHFTGPDLNLLRHILSKLWKQITQPVVEKRYGLNDFFKVYKEKQHIFTNDNVINNATVLEYATKKEEVFNDNENVDDLPLHSKFILIASFLASFNEPRTDVHFFSKIKLKKKKLTASPSKIAKIKKGHMTKGDIDARLLQPNYFDLERMLAILSVIYRAHSKALLQSEREEILNIYEDPSLSEEKKQAEISKFTLSRNSDLNSQIATLFSLGLLVKSANSDILGAKVRWKCNIPWNTVEALAANVNFPIHEYLNNNQYS